MLMKILSGLHRLAEAREEFTIHISRLDLADSAGSVSIKIVSRYIERVPSIEKYYQDLYVELLNRGGHGVILEFGTLNCWLGLPTGHEQAAEYLITLEFVLEYAAKIPLIKTWPPESVRTFPEIAVNWPLVDDLAAVA